MTSRILRSDWLVTTSTERTVAQNLCSREEVELRGELHDDLQSGGTMLRALAQTTGQFTSLVTALDSASVAPTLGSLLRGSGWNLLFVELTGQCNEHCQHCYASSSPTVTAALDWEMVEALLSDARALGFETVQFTGGDPLLSPLLERAIRRARQLGFARIEVYTNALAFNEGWADLFAQNGVSMAVSLYSHDPVVHDAVTRTVASHARTSREIRRAVQRGLSVRIGSVSGVLGDVDEEALRGYVAELGVLDDKLTLDRERPVGRGTWGESAPTMSYSPASHRSSSEGQGGRLCVTYNADIVPCVFDRKTKIGNLRETTLLAALAAPAHPARAQSSLKMVGEPLACIECQFRRELLQSTELNSSQSCPQ